MTCGDLKSKLKQFGFKRQEDLANIHAGVAIEQTQYGSMFVWLGNDCFGKLKQTTLFLICNVYVNLDSVPVDV